MTTNQERMIRKLLRAEHCAAETARRECIDHAFVMEQVELTEETLANSTLASNIARMLLARG